MKKQLLLLLLFAIFSFNGWTQSISFTSVPTSTTVGTNLVVNYKYTAATTGKVTFFIGKYGVTDPWDFISDVAYAETPAVVGTDVTGSFTVLIPNGTTPTANLTGNQNYRFKLELWDASNVWLAGDTDSQNNYNFTAAAAVPAVSVTSIPTSTQVGTNLVVNYKYTAAAEGKVSIEVTKRGGANADDYISTVGYMVLDPAVAGTDVTGSFTVLIPNGTTPTANLTGNQNYRFKLELWDASNVWLAGDYSTINYNFTAPPNTWVGGTSSSWTDGSNWNNGVPDATMDVIIGTGTFQPIIASNVSIKSLKLNELTSLTVNSGNNITVAGAITNNGLMTIENNANLIQAGTTNANTGNIIVKRNSNALSRLDYTSWSSPVSNASQFLTTFSPLTLTNRFYNYNEATNQYNEISSPSSTIFAVGSGYLIRMPNTAVAAPATEVFTGVFTGVPNNGTINKVITYNGSAPFGYNLVGNPYPSAIDAQVFITANTTNIESSLYFWRKINNASGSSYAVYNPLGGTAATPSSGVPNGIIQVGQSFFVKAKSTSSVSFNNSMRVANNDNQFFRTNQLASKDRLWLNLTSTSGIFSQTLIGYTADATTDVDMYDAKYIGDSSICLTSKINGEEYTIQGRPAFDVSDVVGLNFKTDAAGDYTIGLDHFDGLFAAGQDVYLKDNTTDVETDLKAGAYTFAAAAGVDNTRFSLKYQRRLKVDASAFNENSVRVYRNNGALYVNSGNIAISKITVFDIQGRLITEQKNVKATSAVINNLKTVHQVLIVKIVSEDNKEVTKKVVN